MKEIERVFKKLEKAGDMCYDLKGKRVVLSKLNDKKEKISYENFFKMSFVKENDRYTIKIGDENGVDVMSLALLGMCISLSSLGYITAKVTDTESSCEDLLHVVYDFAQSRGLGIETAEEYLSVENKLKEIFQINGVSSQTLRNHMEKSEHPSMYFVRYMGTSSLRPNSDAILQVMSNLVCMAQTEWGYRGVVETFCKYCPFVSLIGLQLITNDSFNNVLDVLLTNDFSADVIDLLTGERYLKFGYGRNDISENVSVTDMELLSLIIAYSFANYIFIGRSSFDAEVNEFEDFFGNDFLKDYILKGDVKSFVRFTNKSFEIDTDNFGYSIPSSFLFAQAKFLQDLESLEHSIHDYEGCASQTFMYCTYADAHFVLSRYASKVMESNKSVADAIKKKSEQSLGYQKKRNAQLSDTNKQLKNDMKVLKEQLDSMSKMSTSVSKEEHQTLKSDYEKLLSNFEILESKYKELECNYNSTVSDLDSLLDSLQVSEEKENIGVSLQEVCDFLNGYKVCIIGGRLDLASRLNDLGLYNFVQVSEMGDINRLNGIDFSVSMTSFMSHKMYHGVMSKATLDKSQHMYYNGTNIEKLLFDLYEFINKFFGIDE